MFCIAPAVRVDTGYGVDMVTVGSWLLPPQRTRGSQPWGSRPREFQPQESQAHRACALGSDVLAGVPLTA